MKNRNKIIAITLLALVCLALSQTAQALNPPPDGGYSGGNTAEGDGTLNSLTTGSFNTAAGFDALFSNTTGFANTANGDYALYSNTTGSGNTATGGVALYSNTLGRDNTAIGADALHTNTSGRRNTAVGVAAMDGTGQNGVGGENTAIGFGALNSTADGSQNTAVGSNALGNVGEGIPGTSPSDNIALGYWAGLLLAEGNGNIYIGNVGPGNVQNGGGTESNTIRIGQQTAFTDPFTGVTLPANTATYIAGISGTAVTGSAVVVTSSGQLGVKPSSERFKTQIKPMDKASEAVLALRPVTFRYKKEIDPDGTPQFGLVAEDVEKVNSDLVLRDVDGKPYTVRYEAVNAMLLNEFLKEHRTVLEQEGTIAQLKSGMEALAATVREQAVQIQKVSAQFEMTKPAPQTVLNQ